MYSGLLTQLPFSFELTESAIVLFARDQHRHPAMMAPYYGLVIILNQSFVLFYGNCAY